MTQIEDARLINLPRHAGDDGELVVAETAVQVPFRIERMFVLAASAGAKRGRHAHRLCSQLMVCVSGAVSVICEDGSKEKAFTLDRRDLGLLVPPGIWNTVVFRQDGSVVAVLCDRPYEERYYIRDYAEFLSLRESSRA